MIQTKEIKPPFVSVKRERPWNLIVIHATAGNSLMGAIITLRQRKLGYHYLIDKNGVIYKGVPLSRYTYHAGNSYGPRQEAEGVSKVQNSESKFVANVSVNPDSIGISLVNDGKSPFTEAQYKACEALVEELREAFPSIKWLAGHKDVSPRRKPDPYDFDLERVIGPLKHYKVKK